MVFTFILSPRSCMTARARTTPVVIAPPVAITSHPACELRGRLVLLIQAGFFDQDESTQLVGLSAG